MRRDVVKYVRWCFSFFVYPSQSCQTYALCNYNFRHLRERERETNTEHAILDHCFRGISNLDLSRHGQVCHSRAGIFRLRAWRWALKAWCSALRSCFSALRAWCWACAKCPQSLVNDWHVGLQVLIIPLRTCTFGGDVMVIDEGVTRCYTRKMKPTHCLQVWVFVIWVQTS